MKRIKIDVYDDDLQTIRVKEMYIYVQSTTYIYTHTAGSEVKEPSIQIPKDLLHPPSLLSTLRCILL